MLRIGELSRRVGVSDHVLRAWESRYGLLQPVRSAGGFRSYSEADAQRVRRMRAYLASGLSAAEAAQAVLGEDSEPRTETARPGHLPATAGELSGALRRALDAFDEPAAQTVLDRLISDLSLTTVFREVVLPYLAELGQRWEQGTASIAQEHFASNLIHGRLAGLARGWGTGVAPTPSWRAPGRVRRPGADDLRHRPQPHRMEDRLSRDQYPGRGAFPGRRCEATGPRRHGHHHAGDSQTPRRAAHHAGPARSRWSWPGPEPRRNWRPPCRPGWRAATRSPRPRRSAGRFPSRITRSLHDNQTWLRRHPAKPQAPSQTTATQPNHRHRR